MEVAVFAVNQDGGGFSRAVTLVGGDRVVTNTILCLARPPNVSTTPKVGGHAEPERHAP